MARIPYVERENAPQEIAETFAKMESRGARVSNLWKMAAHSSSTLLHIIRTGNALLSKTTLSPKLREMAILRTAEILDCDYERKAHTTLGKEVGITDEQIKAIKKWENSGVFNGTEKAVLRFTDEVAKNARVKDETFSDIAKYLDQRMMVELAEVVGFYGMLARILVPFKVDMEDSMSTSSVQIIGRSKE